MSDLTIIVPVYNGERTIKRTLDSLINQTIKDIHILLIDDGSTDNTSSIIDEYSNNYDNIEVIHKENGGIANTRNVGINNVKTPYFGFLDSDDYVENNMYETMLNKITQDNSDLCVCNFIWEWTKKSKKQVDGQYHNPKEMMTRMFSTLWNKIYKTDLIKKYDLSFPDGYRYEDSYFLYCLAGNDIKISFVDDYFVRYVQYEGSITHNHNEKVKDMIHVFEGIKEYYIKHNLLDKYNEEMEFLFVKFFLGNSFLRTCQIKDKQDRNKTLKMSFDALTSNYPNFKENKYLKDFGLLRRTYYKLINSSNYLKIGELIHIVYPIWGAIKGQISN